MKSAVCLLYINDDGMVLSVSRRDNPSQWGFPGGKVDLGESNVEAVQREVFEEIGVLAGDISYEPLFCGPCEGDVNYWVTTYTLKDLVKNIIFVPEPGLSIAWKNMNDLCNIRISPFADYNRRVFAALKERENYE